MSRWRQLWKDVLLTGTGVVVILLQATVYEAHPNGAAIVLIGTGLAFTVPSTWDHIRALIPSGGGLVAACAGVIGGSLVVAIAALVTGVVR